MFIGIRYQPGACSDPRLPRGMRLSRARARAQNPDRLIISCLGLCVLDCVRQRSQGRHSCRVPAAHVQVERLAVVEDGRQAREPSHVPTADVYVERRSAVEHLQQRLTDTIYRATDATTLAQPPLNHKPDNQPPLNHRSQPTIECSGRLGLRSARCERRKG